MASWHIGLRELCLLAVEFALATAFVVAFAAAKGVGTAGWLAVPGHDVSFALRTKDF
jgi:hypothetical protein